MLTFTNISHLRNLRDAINKNPVVLTRSIFEALDYVERGGYIFPTKQDSLALQLAKERCDLFYFEDGKILGPRIFRKAQKFVTVKYFILLRITLFEFQFSKKLLLILE